MFSIARIKQSAAYKLLNLFVAFSFFLSMCVLPSSSSAQGPTVGGTGLPYLPAPGTMITPSVGYTPAIVAGMTLYPENPLQFDFIIDTGDDNLQGEAFRAESKKLINYFLATLTVPEDEMWVNLSPYEEDRIVADGLGVTEMGRDMLAQDYLLKQLAASLMYPEEEVGNKFWKKIYAKTQARFGTTEIPTNTFNKIWIVPDEAVVYTEGNSVFVSKSHLNVMLEEDYLALKSNVGSTKHGLGEMKQDDITQINEEAKEIIREIIIPEIEREVNTGKNFANLRQIYHSMILATWYKKNLKESVLGSVYANANKTNGIELDDKNIKDKIYNQYVEAFEKGVYDYIREDYDAATQEMVPRKYFSGGLEKVRNVKDGAMFADAVIAPGRQRKRYQDGHPLQQPRVAFRVVGDAAPGTPRDAAPGTPRDAAPGTPRDAAPGTPRDAAVLSVTREKRVTIPSRLSTDSVNAQEVIEAIKRIEVLVQSHVLGEHRSDDAPLIIVTAEGDTHYLLMTLAEESGQFGIRHDAQRQEWQIPRENLGDFNQWVVAQLTHLEMASQTREGLDLDVVGEGKVNIPHQRGTETVDASDVVQAIGVILEDMRIDLIRRIMDDRTHVIVDVVEEGPHYLLMSMLANSIITRRDGQWRIPLQNVRELQEWLEEQLSYVVEAAQTRAETDLAVVTVDRVNISSQFVSREDSADAEEVIRTIEKIQTDLRRQIKIPPVTSEAEGIKGEISDDLVIVVQDNELVSPILSLAEKSGGFGLTYYREGQGWGLPRGSFEDLDTWLSDELQDLTGEDTAHVEGDSIPEDDPTPDGAMLGRLVASFFKWRARNALKARLDSDDYKFIRDEHVDRVAELGVENFKIIMTLGYPERKEDGTFSLSPVGMKVVSNTKDIVQARKTVLEGRVDEAVKLITSPSKDKPITSLWFSDLVDGLIEDASRELRRLNHVRKFLTAIAAVSDQISNPEIPGIAAEKFNELDKPADSGSRDRLFRVTLLEARRLVEGGRLIWTAKNEKDLAEIEVNHGVGRPTTEDPTQVVTITDAGDAARYRKLRIKLLRIQGKDDPVSGTDGAMLTAPQRQGGIDFNAENLNLEDQGEAFDFNFTAPVNIQPSTVNGITPVIINITPIINYPFLLGLAEDQELEQLSQL